MLTPPSLVPMLSSYRRSVGGMDADDARLGRLTAVAGVGYFLVWAALGVAAYLLGVGLAEAEMRWQALARSVPIATGAVLLLAGCVQLTGWKARQLRRCRDEPGCGSTPPPDARSAWRYGLALGARRGLCCARFTMILLVMGAMDLGAMAVVGAAITVERFAPRPEPVARATGAIAIAAGALAIARALGVA